MKLTAYTSCFEAIKNAILENPIVCEPFTIYFDNEELERIKTEYGYDLYIGCLDEVKRKFSLND